MSTVCWRHTHLYSSDSLCNASPTPGCLTSCTSDVATWCTVHRLQFSVDQTEAIWFGCRINLSKLDSSHKTMTLGAEHVDAVSIVRDLELSWKQHIAKLSSGCFLNLRHIRQLHRRVCRDISTHLILVLVTSRLDHCNSILAGPPCNTIRPLQRVQNTAVSLIFDLNTRDYVTTGLIQLHWLPVQYRITYKLCALRFAIHTRQSPVYMANLVSIASSRSSRSNFQSSDSRDYVKPRVRSKLSERAYFYARPSAWNARPTFICSQAALSGFKRALKTRFKLFLIFTCSQFLPLIVMHLCCSCNRGNNKCSNNNNDNLLLLLLVTKPPRCDHILDLVFCSGFSVAF